MTRSTIVAGLALALVACSATPKDGEIMEGDVRMQPVALATDGAPAHCSARAVLMHRSRLKPSWETSADAPATLHVPRDARVVEVACVPAGGGVPTVRYLTSEESSEAKGGQAATGAMFLLLGGLPALATGMAQRSDVYEFPATVTVELAPPAGSDGAAYAARRAEEIERDVEAWRKVRWSLCEAEQSPGASAMDDHCRRDLDEVKARREALLAELKSMQAAQN